MEEIAAATKRDGTAGYDDAQSELHDASAGNASSAASSSAAGYDDAPATNIQS